MGVIGVRLGISPTKVQGINREFQVRAYNGQHIVFTRADEIVRS